MRERFVPVEYQCLQCKKRFLMTEYPADCCWFCGSPDIVDRRFLKKRKER
ncbi:hypothetical protein C8P63_1405 [Melghirimyces profundicolus]|uniref:Uncharacterized protein n=1 Tax=Melghirimyces profundicolus TaxID=1242148 RepID=A0A2T6B0N2_9BACL|nr:hypothetical protein C8P63_1405 [Melghirimyces profundicolus]